MNRYDSSRTIPTQVISGSLQSRRDQLYPPAVGDLNYIAFGSFPPTCYDSIELRSVLYNSTVSDIVSRERRSTAFNRSTLHTSCYTYQLSQLLHYSDSSARKSTYGEIVYLAGILFNLPTTIGRYNGVVTNNPAHLSRPWEWRLLQWITRLAMQHSADSLLLVNNGYLIRLSCNLLVRPVWNSHLFY